MAYVKPEKVAGEDYLFVRRGARATPISIAVERPPSRIS